MAAVNTCMNRKRRMVKFKKNIPLHLMLLPGVLLILIFNYLPMGGIAMAFQDYKVTKGLFRSEWVGLYNFRFLMSYPDFWNIMKNTVCIAGMKLILGLAVPVIFALMLNEIRSKYFAKITQTLVYLPNFLSWVILAIILLGIWIAIHRLVYPDSFVKVVDNHSFGPEYLQ